MQVKLKLCHINRLRISIYKNPKMIVRPNGIQNKQSCCDLMKKLYVRREEESDPHSLSVDFKLTLLNLVEKIFNLLKHLAFILFIVV